MKKKYDGLFKLRTGSGIGAAFAIGYGIPLFFTCWIVESCLAGHEVNKNKYIISLALFGVLGASCGTAINYAALKLRHGAPNERAGILLFGLYAAGFNNLYSKGRDRDFSLLKNLKELQSEEHYLIYGPQSHDNIVQQNRVEIKS